MDVVVRKLDVLRCTVNVLGRGDPVAKTVLALIVAIWSAWANLGMI